MQVQPPLDHQYSRLTEWAATVIDDVMEVKVGESNSSTRPVITTSLNPAQTLHLAEVS